MGVLSSTYQLYINRILTSLFVFGDKIYSRGLFSHKFVMILINSHTKDVFSLKYIYTTGASRIE